MASLAIFTEYVLPIFYREVYVTCEWTPEQVGVDIVASMKVKVMLTDQAYPMSGRYKLWNAPSRSPLQTHYVLRDAGNKIQREGGWSSKAERGLSFWKVFWYF